MKAENPLLFYITIPDEATGETIVHDLLKKNLIACGNILPAHKSIYQWDGQVRSETEHVLILKTRTALRDPVEKRVEELHPFKCPCIVAIDSSSANPLFKEWIDIQTTPS